MTLLLCYLYWSIRFEHKKINKTNDDGPYSRFQNQNLMKNLLILKAFALILEFNLENSQLL